MPWMIHFADPQNPKSAEEVDPANLSKTLGAGAELVSVTASPTVAPVTRGQIVKYLPWLPSLKGKTLNGKPDSPSNNLADEIYAQALSEE